MPVFRIKAPDGKTIKITAPEGTTREEALERAKREYQPEAQQSESSLLDKTADVMRGPGQMLLQGATFGFGDELRGLADYMMGGDYKLGTEAARGEQEQYREENPIGSFGLEMAGGLSTGIPGAAKAGASRVGQWAGSNLPRWLKYAGAGGAGGGVAGAGYSEEGERLEGAGKGATAGAGLGALLPPVARGVKGVTSPVIRAFQPASSRANRKLGQALERDLVTPERARANLAKLGPQGTIADAGGENVLGLAEQAVQTPGKGRNQALGMLQRRQSGQHGRVMDALTDQLGDEQNFYETLRQIGRQKQVSAKPLYEKAYAVEIPFSDDLQQLVKRPVVQDAMKKALRIAANEGDDISTSFRIEGDEITGLENPSTKVWDYVKRGLDDVIEDNTGELGRVNNTGRIANNIKRELLSELDEVNPDYREARRVFAGEAANENALKMGRNVLKDDADITQDVIARMSEAEKDYFRAGAMRAVRDKLESATDTSDAYKRIFNKASLRNRLESVFPDKKSFAQFARQMKNESTFYRTRERATGNSATFRRLAQESDINIDPEFMSGAVLSPQYATARTAIRSIINRLGLPENVRNELTGMLYTQNPAQQQQILQQLERLSQPGLLSGAGPGVITGTGGQVGGLLTR